MRKNRSRVDTHRAIDRKYTQERKAEVHSPYAWHALADYETTSFAFMCPLQRHYLQYSYLDLPYSRVWHPREPRGEGASASRHRHRHTHAFRRHHLRTPRLGPTPTCATNVAKPTRPDWKQGVGHGACKISGKDFLAPRLQHRYLVYSTGGSTYVSSHHLVAGLRDLRVPPQAYVTPAGADLLDGEGHAEHVHHGAQLPALSSWPPGRGQLLQAHDRVGDYLVEDAHDAHS